MPKAHSPNELAVRAATISRASKSWRQPPPVQSLQHQNVLAVRSEAAASESIRLYHQPTVSLQSGEIPSLSASNAVRDTPQTEVDDSVEDLLGWFLVFVDMGCPSTSVTSGDEPAMTEIEEGFCQLQEKLYLTHWRNGYSKVLPAPFAQLENLAAMCWGS